MEKKFTVAQVRDLLNQVHSDKITFSRFVEVLNEMAAPYFHTEEEKHPGFGSFAHHTNTVMPFTPEQYLQRKYGSKKAFNISFEDMEEYAEYYRSVLNMDTKY